MQLNSMYWSGSYMTIQNKADDGLTQDMISHILRLHELGLSQKAIRINLYEIYHIKVSLSQINRITGKVDHLVNEWLDRLRKVGH
jgi:transposase-like protein